ncbi:MAG TPA: hypothetical protein VFZ38_05575, partial [Vicinamibacterales bacterium]
MIRRFAIPLGFTAALLAMTAMPRVQATPVLTWSFWGAGGVLLVWQILLAALGKRPFRIVKVPP